MKNKTAMVILFSLIAAFIQTVTIGVMSSFFASFVFYTLLLCIGSLLAVSAMMNKKNSLVKLSMIAGLDACNSKLIIIGILSGFIIDIAMLAGFFIFYKYFDNAKAVIDAVSAMGIQKNHTLIIAILGLVINAGAEEIFWRGTLHSILGNYTDGQSQSSKTIFASKALKRIVLVSLLFGINHIGIMVRLAPSLPAGLLSLLGITLTGALWSAMREKTGSILPALISHVVVTLGYSGLLVFYIVSYRA